MNKRLRSISAKIMILVLSATIVTTVLFGVITYMAMHSMRGMMLDSHANLEQTATEKSAEALTAQAQSHLLDIVKEAAELDNERLSDIQSQVEMLAFLAENTYRQPEQYPLRKINSPQMENDGRLAAQLVFGQGYTDTENVREEIGRLAHLQDTFVAFAADNPSIGGVYIGTESGFTLIADTMSGSRLAPDYRHTIQERPWYRLASQKAGTIWTNVMEDATGRGLGIVCAAPVYRPDGTMAAVVGIGSLLTDLQQRIAVSIGERGYMFLVNEEGAVILSGSQHGAFAMRRPGDTDTHSQWLSSAELSDVRMQMVDKKQGVTELVVDDVPVYLAYSPIETLGWSLGAVIEREEIIAPVAEMRQDIGESSQRIMGQIDAQMINTLLLVLSLLAMVAAVVTLYGIWFSRRLTAPLSSLMKGVGQIGSGNLQCRIQVKTGDEFETLADAFNNMTEELGKYMAHLTQVTADKERISTELQVATRIQTGMLPCIFPPFPARPEFDLYATMHPAKEVGGDFYDFFMIDDKQIGIVIADVSGKGVPAALFMVIAKTLIKNHAQSGLEPSEVFRQVNNQLCENNEEGMFVTAFLGVLDVESGRFTYVNAGHNPSLIAQGGGPYRWLKERSGLILAGMEGTVYQQFKTFLQPGDRIFLYTDGVTEAQNTKQDLFGEHRLIELFHTETLAETCSHQCLELLTQRLAEFTDGAEQADDITMLFLRIR